MNKKSIYLLLLLTCVVSCVENPNVTEDIYLENPNSVRSWVAGLKRQLAVTANTVNVNVAITSDNYFNNYSQYSKVFDIPQIDYFDVDVNSLQVDVQALREMAVYGISTVVIADASVTAKDEAFMHFCLGYANILGGELFTGLPETNLGTVLPPEQIFERALSNLDDAINLETDPERIAVYRLLKARVYYNTGEAANAIEAARAALSSPSLLYQAQFDGENDLGNEMQNAVFDASPNRLAPLPRLDFLDPKYYSEGTPETDQKPVALAKAEEAYLILAEAYLAQQNITEARGTLQSLLTLVGERPVVSVDDSGETRNGGNRDDYPLTGVAVRFDSESPYREGYVLDRQAGNIDIHTVSGTSVTTDDIENAATVDELLYLVYQLRQEIFIGEGRRLTDLGIKYPVSQIEQDNNPNVPDAYTVARIPSFIPGEGQLDDFRVEADGRITIDVDMNKIIVANKNAAEIVPFF
ncbi:tetratricopeptide repeat protein [Sinomicrobium kalidii]|uniref:tetratricopeptide repeat protein n=1 Tax=Sinomicrobium kalidii TaxID=2900738 RepID=UPI001E3FA73E|nr:tetratricopeptide repeat protein [Sinomicrobium kalidii]UGU16457.1 tetratricopeptide repeat protein [Sinomicrobium kalidii]